MQASILWVGSSELRFAYIEAHDNRWRPSLILEWVTDLFLLASTSTARYCGMMRKASLSKHAANIPHFSSRRTI